MENKTRHDSFGILLVAIFMLTGCVTADYATSPAGPAGPPIQVSDFRLIGLEMTPDPIREGQKVRFVVTVENRGYYSGRTRLVIRDNDQIVAEASDVRVRPGSNVIEFPWTGYRFNRNDHCFVVALDVEGNWRTFDQAKSFCAYRTERGWSLSQGPPAPVRPPVVSPPPPPVGPLFVEELYMSPDPVQQKQDIQFSVRLRNDGRHIRGDIRIQDKDEIVVRLENAAIPKGVSRFQFPYTGYEFHRSDHCFTVIVDVDRTPYRVDSARKFCARKNPKGPGYTLR